MRVIARKYFPAGINLANDLARLGALLSRGNDPATTNAPPLKVSSLNGSVHDPMVPRVRYAGMTEMQ